MTDQLKLLQSFPERLLIEKIIIPLFIKLGYHTVDYSHGSDEKGKDLIMWKDNETDEIELTVVQVKKLQPSGSATGNNSFSSLINQLQQCCEKSIPYKDGLRHFPEKVYFITPFEVNAHSLESRFEGYQQLRRVKIIDGPKIVSLIEKYLPDILVNLASPLLKIHKSTLKDLTNVTLMQALEQPEGRPVVSFYTDIDFTIGSPSTQKLFNDLKPNDKIKASINLSNWFDYQLLAEKLLNIIGCELFENKTLLSLQKLFTRKHREHRDWEVQHNQLINEQIAVSDKRFELVQKLKILRSTESSEKENKNENKNGVLSIDQINIEIEQADKKLKNLLKSINNSSKNEPRFQIDVSFRSNKLVMHLERLRNSLIGQISNYNSYPDLKSLNMLLENANKTFQLIRDIKKINSVAEACGFLNSRIRKISSEKTRLKTSLLKVFETNKNVSILGVAGAGKTTTLQMYAQRLIINKTEHRLILFIPLIRMSKLYNELSTQEKKILINSNEGKQLEALITKYISSLGVDLSITDWQHIVTERGAVILFDGIDEVIHTIPWVLNEIRQLSERYSKIQFIISSRIVGNYIDQLPFISVVILPFTKKQIKEFIKHWFSEVDSKTYNRVINHLKENAQIAELVSIPLLTTILCILAQFGLDLPKSEVRLYDERLKLLLGHYDFHKGVRRLQTHSSHLEMLARKLAFYFHENHNKSIELARAYEISKFSLSQELKEESAKIALQELIDPCNVLFITPSNEITFGHLRYQEHLAAREILFKSWYRLISSYAR